MSVPPGVVRTLATQPYTLGNEQNQQDVSVAPVHPCCFRCTRTASLLAAQAACTPMPSGAACLQGDEGDALDDLEGVEGGYEGQQGGDGGHGDHAVKQHSHVASRAAGTHAAARRHAARQQLEAEATKFKLAMAGEPHTCMRVLESTRQRQTVCRALLLRATLAPADKEEAQPWYAKLAFWRPRPTAILAGAKRQLHPSPELALTFVWPFLVW